MQTDNKSHWESVYATKRPDEVSWTQDNPKTSLDFIRKTNLGKKTKIIDIGGGDSKLIDFLLEEGYENLTVLDISSNALERAKIRLGDKAAKVNWIVSDINEFQPESNYDIWHDRATFHFLTNQEHIYNYVKTAQQWISGFLIIGTFSDQGPLKCSGLEIKQYNENALEEEFKEKFEKVKCINEDHKTPFETLQNFVFCVFKKK